MRIDLPAHQLSIEPSDEWTVDPIDARTVDVHGIYLRSNRHGIYVNVRGQGSPHPLTEAGLLALLREQSWGVPPVPEWSERFGELIVVGGTFAPPNLGGEVVLEVFVTDGRCLANLACPGEAGAIAGLLDAVKRLAQTLRFDSPKGPTRGA